MNEDRTSRPTLSAHPHKTDVPGFGLVNQPRTRCARERTPLARRWQFSEFGDRARKCGSEPGSRPCWRLPVKRWMAFQ